MRNQPTLPPITRRQFLQAAGLTAGAVGLNQLLRNLGLTPATPYRGPLRLEGDGRGRRVIILGAGIAGLVAAYEMSRVGYDCLVLEARQRVGGRCWTIRGGDSWQEMDGTTQTAVLDAGQFFNPGPDRIPQEHRGILSYCRELGVPLRAFVSMNTAAYYYHENVGPLSGEKVRLRQAWVDLNGYLAELLAKAARKRALADDLGDDERELLLEYLEAYGHLTEAGDEEDPEDAAGAEDENGAPTDNGELVYEGDGNAGYETPPGAFDQEGEPLEPLALSDLLQAGYWQHFPFNWEYHQQMALLHPDGGMDRIAQALSQPISGLIRLGAEVRAIRRAADGVRVVYQEQGGPAQEVSGDYCICTLPLPALAQIETDLAALANAATAVPYLPAVKVGLQFARRFWEDDDHIYAGGSFTNLNIGQIWYPAWGYHAAKGVVDGAYVVGAAAAQLGQLAPDGRVQAALEQGSKIHPQYPDEFESGVSVAWQQLPHSQGAWAVYSAEQRANLYPQLRQLDDFIYLAGEHMSYLNGWLEGAVVSAHDVVERIHARVQQE